jgi:hypothetical protein
MPPHHPTYTHKESAYRAKLEAAHIAKRDEVVKFFATPNTISRFAVATRLNYDRARTRVTDWFDGTYLFDAGMTQVDLYHPGRPAQLYCSDEATAREYKAKYDRGDPVATPRGGPILDFFATPRTVEEYACATQQPLGIASNVVEAEFYGAEQTIFIAGMCSPEGTSKEGKPYPRAVSWLYCSNKVTARRALWAWAAARWEAAGCPDSESEGA